MFWKGVECALRVQSRFSEYFVRSYRANRGRRKAFGKVSYQILMLPVDRKRAKDHTGCVK